MKFTTETINRGVEKYEAMYRAVARMDGNKEAVTAIWNEVYPGQTYEQLEKSLMMMQMTGYVTNLTIANGHIVGNIHPVVTDNAWKDVEERKTL